MNNNNNNKTIQLKTGLQVKHYKKPNGIVSITVSQKTT